MSNPVFSRKSGGGGRRNCVWQFEVASEFRKYSHGNYIPPNGFYLTTSLCVRILNKLAPPQGKSRHFFSISVSATCAKVANGRIPYKSNSGKGHGHCSQFSSACRAFLACILASSGQSNIICKLSSTTPASSFPHLRQFGVSLFFGYSSDSIAWYNIRICFF